MSRLISKLKSISHMNKKSILFRILLFNAVFVLCMVIVAIVNNFSLKNITISEINSSNRNFVNYVVDVMDNQMEEVKKLAYTYGKDSDVAQISNSYTITGNDSITLKKVIDKFIVAKATKNIIDDIFIYFKSQDMVVSSKGTFEADFFFNKYILNLKEQVPQIDTGTGRLMLLPRTEMKKLGEDYNYREFGVISYIYPINRNSYLHIMVNEGNIRKSLYDASYDKDNIIIILDSNDKLISSNVDIVGNGITTVSLMEISKETSESTKNIVALANRKYIVNNRTSKTTGFRYFVIFPIKNVQERVATVNKNTFLLVLAFLLFGVLLTFILSKEIYMPIKKIISLLDVGATMNKNKISEFDTISHGIDAMSKENEKFIYTLQKQQPYIEEISLNRLMCDMVFDNTSDVISELNLKYREFVILSVVMDKRHADNKKGAWNKLEWVLGEEFAFQKLYSHSSENLYIIRVNSYKDFVDRVRHIVCVNFADNEGVMLGVSGIHSNILDIKKACKESVQSLKYRSTTDTCEKVYTFESISIQELIMPRANLEEEILLINNIFNGNIKNVTAYIDRFEAENQDLPFTYQKDGIIYLVSLLLMTMPNKSIKYEEIFDETEKDFYTQLDECENIVRLRKMLRELYIGVTDYCGSKLKEDDNKMLDYVNENFHRGICLDLLAEKMGLSPSYVSAYFKKVTGVNFLVYVNNLKLKKAKEMLTDTNKSISEIAETLGFGDSNTFIRLFKKMEGITPGTYRKEHIRGNMY